MVDTSVQSLKIGAVPTYNLLLFLHTNGAVLIHFCVCHDVIVLGELNRVTSGLSRMEISVHHLYSTLKLVKIEEFLEKNV